MVDCPTAVHYLPPTKKYMDIMKRRITYWPLQCSNTEQSECPNFFGCVSGMKICLYLQNAINLLSETTENRCLLLHKDSNY